MSRPTHPAGRRVVCGVDSSTQATKVVLRDAESGDVVGAGRAEHPATTPPRSEQPPSAWWSALGDALGQAAARAGAPQTVAVSVAAQQHGLVALDAHGEVVRPAKLWNDTESAGQARRLVDALGAPAWAAACGSVPVASFTVTKLAWLAEREPAAYRRVARCLLPHDWLTWRLTGAFVTDRGDASGTGYWSPRDGAWRPDLLALIDDRCDWPARLPAVLDPAEPAGRVLDPPVACLAGDALVGAGSGDNMAAALGLGLRAGDLVVSLGTSGTVFAVAEVPTADATGAVAGFADATGRFLPLVCTLNATKVTDTVARLLDADRARFDALALGAPAGAHGVTLLPYLDGERTPNRPDATGTLTGLTTATGPADLARAAVEGVVCGLLDGVDALAAAGVDTGGRLLLVGGGARSAAFRRVLADLAGRPVHAFGDHELVALGAAVQAAAVGGDRPLDRVAAEWAVPPDVVVDPDPAAPAAEVRARYAALRAATV